MGGGRRGKKPPKDPPALPSFSSMKCVSSGPEQGSKLGIKDSVLWERLPFFSSIITLMLFRSQTPQIPQHRDPGAHSKVDVWRRPADQEAICYGQKADSCVAYIHAWLKSHRKQWKMAVHHKGREILGPNPPWRSHCVPLISHLLLCSMLLV